jgi:hypothetical protein
MEEALACCSRFAVGCMREPWRTLSTATIGAGPLGCFSVESTALENEEEMLVFVSLQGECIGRQ